MPTPPTDDELNDLIYHAIKSPTNERGGWSADGAARRVLRDLREAGALISTDEPAAMHGEG